MGGHESLIVISKRVGPILRSHPHSPLKWSEGSENCSNRCPFFFPFPGKESRTGEGLECCNYSVIEGTIIYKELPPQAPSDE